MRTIQLVGGSRDGDVLNVPDHMRELLVPVPRPASTLVQLGERAVFLGGLERIERYAPFALPSSPGFRFWYERS